MNFFFYYQILLIRLPAAATFKLPSRKRGWGCVDANLHTPLSPLFRGESQKMKFLYIKLVSYTCLYLYRRMDTPNCQVNPQKVFQR